MATLKTGSKIGAYPYRIVKPLGGDHGAMADVYLARLGDNPEMAQYVVLKLSKADADNEDFFHNTIYNESERLRRLSHPGIVRILSIQTDNHLPQTIYAARANLVTGKPWFLILEYLDGGSLAELLHTGPLELSLALQVMRTLADTLDHLHRSDLVHLDLKPENILFRRQVARGSAIEPIIIDFGIARNTGQEGLEARTILYAPPERVQINKGVVAPERIPRPQPSMDIYSLGVVLYQMVSGRRPFEGRTNHSISSAILAGNPTTPSKYVASISPELDRLILQMLDKNPIKRPTAGELVYQIEQMMRTVAPRPVARPMAGPATPQRRTRQRRHPFVWLGMGFVLLLLVLLAAETAYLLRNNEPWLPTTAKLTELWAGAYGDSQQPSTLPADGSPAVDGSGNQPVAAPGAVPVVDKILVVTSTLESPTAETIVEQDSTQTSTPVVSERPTSTPLGPRPAPTLAPTLTATPTPPTPTSTPVVEFTKMPTSTPIGTRIPTATPLDTSTARPAAIASSTPRPLTKVVQPLDSGSTLVRKATSTPVEATVIVPTPTATATAVDPPTPKPTPKPALPAQGSVRLLAPSDGTGGTREEFRWQADFALSEHQAYEPIFWKAGQNPMRDGRGWGGTTVGSSTKIDFAKLGKPAPDTYQWGVLLVETQPAYKRLAFLGGGWRYSVHGTNSASDAPSDSSPGSTPDSNDNGGQDTSRGGVDKDSN